MAQPPLSQQIQQLEKEIGVQLFTRTKRRVELTLAGTVFLTEARAILERTESAVRKTQRASRGEAGWLGVGFAASSTYDVLPDILRTFRERYPEVELELIEMVWNEQEVALREGRIHVGFSRLPLPNDGITLEPVTEEALIVALPSSHPLAARPAVSLAELAGEPFILFPPLAQSSYAEHILELCHAAGFAPRIVQETGETHTAISLVAAGIGLAIVPDALHNLMRANVTYRPLTDPTPRIELTMVYRTHDPSPVLPNFLRTVRAVVTQRP